MSVHAISMPLVNKVPGPGIWAPPQKNVLMTAEPMASMPVHTG